MSSSPDSEPDWEVMCVKLKKRLDEITSKAETLDGEKKRLDIEVSQLNKKIERRAEQNRAVVTTYRDKISTLERELIRRDGKVEVLEEARRTLQETIKELKEEVKEYRQWARSVKTQPQASQATQ